MLDLLPFAFPYLSYVQWFSNSGSQFVAHRTHLHSDVCSAYQPFQSGSNRSVWLIVTSISLILSSKYSRFSGSGLSLSFYALCTICSSGSFDYSFDAMDSYANVWKFFRATTNNSGHSTTFVKSISIPKKTNIWWKVENSRIDDSVVSSSTRNKKRHQQMTSPIGRNHFLLDSSVALMTFISWYDREVLEFLGGTRAYTEKNDRSSGENDTFFFST